MVHSNSAKKLLRIGVICGSVLLVAAVAYCGLTDSPYMNLVPWIPGFVGDWADRNPDFRNFPAFAGLCAASIFVAVGLRGRLDRIGRTVIMCIAGTSLFGTALELAQFSLIPSRTASWMDVIWSCLGAAAGGVGSFLILLWAGGSTHKSPSPNLD